MLAALSSQAARSLPVPSTGISGPLGHPCTPACAVERVRILSPQPGVISASQSWPGPSAALSGHHRHRLPDDIAPFPLPQVPQEGLPSDPFRSTLLCPQPQALAQSVLQAEMDCDLHSSLQVCDHPQPTALLHSVPCGAQEEVTGFVPPVQPLFFPADASCSGVFPHRSISPSSLLDTAISEEARQGPSLEEEPEAHEPLRGSTGRRHTLAEVSAHFSPLAPPCKCPHGPDTWAEMDLSAFLRPPAYTSSIYRLYYTHFGGGDHLGLGLAPGHLSSGSALTGHPLAGP